MPIALLLREVTLTFRFGAKQLTPWLHLVVEEELLIDRARSAFLVRWFGMNLPLQGSYLKVVIENLRELRDRYLAVSQSVQPELDGPNLTEPLAGAVGQVAGLVFSPTGGILLIAASVRKLKTWVAWLVGILDSIIRTPVVTVAAVGLVIGLGTPAGLLVGLYLGGTKDEQTGAVIDLLGALASLLRSARVFMEQLMGPREQVVNPLFRQMLGLFDRLAGLVPHLLGFIAVVVTKLGPFLLPLADQLKAFQALIGPVIDALTFILKDLFQRLQDFLDLKHSSLRMITVVVGQLQHLLSALVDLFTQFFENATDALTGIFRQLIGESGKPGSGFQGFIDRLRALTTGPKPSTGFTGFIETVVDRLDRAVNENPLVLNMKAAKATLAIAGDALVDKSKPSTSTSSMPPFPKIDITPLEVVKQALGGEPLLGFWAINPLGKLDSLLNGFLFGQAVPLSEEARKELERARHPVSVFQAEREDLRAALGGRTPKQALGDQLAAQQQLRNLITGVVGRVLPPELRPYLDDVVGGFAALDAKLYSAKKLDQIDYPVRDIPDNGLLRPVVHRLVLKAKGSNQLELQDFEDRVHKALLAQTYPAPAVT